ncbi:hypothetical protein DRO69_01200 [Candidatus Bathyarchaeota archaeon]|nr:MAG: hypothetical protein DRO69_01200 [Candidatus Bathyarchaeota archaeon]
MAKIGKDVIGKQVKLRKKKRLPLISFRKVNANMISSLNKVRIKYFFTGAFAVNYYGRPRTSMDVDVMVERNKEKLNKLVEALKRKGFDVIKRDVDIAFKESSHFSVFSKDSPYYFDFKIVPETERHVFERIKSVVIYNKRTFLSSPEDLIINKLVFGSVEDIKDVKSIINRRREKLDYDYLFELAKVKGVTSKLEELLKE